MDIDLSCRNISELCFDNEVITREEALATAAVGSLCVTRNQITRIQGLDVAFKNLTRLDLSHNALGERTTLISACLAMAQRGPTAMHAPDYYCEGVAQWILALPPTLESLDVSHNHLKSFVQCSCTSTDGALSSSTVSSATPSEFYIRYLRHACPLTLGLFFDRHRFPKLCHLNLSHNTLEVSVAESDAMEDVFRRSFPKALRTDSVRCCTCAVEDLNVSYNTGLASVNCFLFNNYMPENDGGLSLAPPSSFPLSALDLQGSGVTDLVGLSGVYPFAPSLQRLKLNGSPIKQTILGSNHAVKGNIIESLLLSASKEFTFHKSEYELGGTDKAPSYQKVALCKAVQDLIQNHRVLFTESLQNYLASSTSAKHLVDLGSCVYASVLLEVIPSLRLLDGYLHVAECKDAIINATQSSLIVLSTAPNSQFSKATIQPSRTSFKQMDVPNDDEVRLGEGLHRIASKIMPHLRTQVLIGEPSSSQSEESPTPRSQRAFEEFSAAHEHRVSVERESSVVDAPERFPSFRSGHGDRITYEALCQRALELKKELLESQRRCRTYTEHGRQLQTQLVADRKHITDQHREILRLCAERDLIQANTLALKKRLKKRRHELVYGVQAIESQYSSMRKEAAVKQLQQKEKAIKKKQRNLQKRTTLAASSSASGICQPHHENPRQIRSVVLREAAIQSKLRLQKSEEPLAFSTCRFHVASGSVGGRDPSPKPTTAAVENDVKEDESHYYLRSYPQERRIETQKAAQQYCRSISPDQYLQLCEAVRLAEPPKVAPPAGGKAEGGEPPSGDALVAPVHKEVYEGAADLRSLAEQDLSTLSLTELLEVAAAIRHRQLALQQASSQIFKEANTLHHVINTAPFEASSIMHATDSALITSSRQRGSSLQRTDQQRNTRNHCRAASEDPVRLQVLNAKHNDSTFLSALERIEIPSSISLPCNDDIESVAVDGLDSLNIFEGDESIESHQFPLKANHLITAPVNLVSDNRALF